MKHNIIPYNPTLKDIARTLRNNSTLGEVMLWKKLRNKQMLGYDFHRQRPIDQFIVDFYSPKLKLAIEIDGFTHHFEETIRKDKKKQHDLEEAGFTVLRFADEEVLHDIENVRRAILFAVETKEQQNNFSSPLPRTPRREE